MTDPLKLPYFFRKIFFFPIYTFLASLDFQRLFSLICVLFWTICVLWGVICVLFASFLRAFSKKEEKSMQKARTELAKE